MLQIIDELRAWHEAGTPYAVATVTDISGSAPKTEGAALAVNADGEAVGGVSGGCVEAAVYEMCRAVLESGVPEVQRFAADPEDVFAPALTCGGDIEVDVRRVVPGTDAALDAVFLPDTALVRTASSFLTVRHDSVFGTLGDTELDHRAVTVARGMLDQGRTGSFTDLCTGQRLFVESLLSAPRLLVFGAVDLGAPLATAGRFLGYHVTVCDARPVFATSSRFPDAHEVVADWPHRYLASTHVDSRTVVCVLTHDAKFDVPLLTVALRLPVGYVGAMGSRRTHEDRLLRLREAGLTSAEIARLRSPIGLDLGASTPQETALSILAEVVADRRGGSGARLGETSGSIHRVA